MDADSASKDSGGTMTASGGMLLIVKVIVNVSERLSSYARGGGHLYECRPQIPDVN